MSAPAVSPQVLVVDDEPDLRTLYELTLLREGYRVDAAGSVAEAVLRRAQCPVLTVRSPKFSPSHRRLVSSPAMPIVNH